MRMKYMIPATLLLALAASPAARADKPAVGSYGFDWLDPELAMCEPITGDMIAGFTECAYGEEYSFELSIPAYACKVNEQSEYIVLPDLIRCMDALDNMKANE